ncbi:hypothetical protein INS49_009944 [Diaporthe citri]|uniref:uncharacterized protein n=1 Tax=Diaporthe citri TaxID=83186 RepID=UPI001C805CEC|nr:uncharacterized protein INS49_009944 [Diaporthe citri]KAG6361716.1 hypothetical protein INS49_009944 [Diaporthe citri]
MSRQPGASWIIKVDHGDLGSKNRNARLRIVDHPATAWDKPKSSSAEDLLRGAAPRQHRSCKSLVQSSFVDSQFRDDHITPSENGFVWAAYHAYSHHHHLCIRPEDIWFAILTQISFYINAHAEDLRSLFVAHEGKKELKAVHHVADFAFLAVQMGDRIGENVLDPELKDWVLPAFSTTTDSDRVVGSILFMGAMQKYFSYSMTVFCGLPSVTLLGCVEDWENILSRLDKLDLFGDEPKRFAAMLRPILRRMVRSFSDPSSTETLDFWNTIVHRNRLGSGTDYLSGWLTAFCFWDEKGKAKAARHPVLEGVAYPTVDVDKVPAGFASVPVSVDDNGHEYKATMVAGSVGILATTSHNPGTSDGAQDTLTIGLKPAMQSEFANLNENIPPLEADEDEDVTSNGERMDLDKSDPGAGQEGPIRDTVQALSGWWMFEIESPQ